MSFEHLDREQLLELLEAALERMRRSSSGQADRELEHEQLVHELRTYQLELEIQNRELREAQLEVERSRDRFAELYEYAPIAYFTLDTHHVVRACNLRAAELLQRRPDQIVARSLFDLVKADASSALHELLARAAQEPGGARTELAVRIGNQPRRVEAVVEASVDPETSALMFRCALLDVTARARAEVERDRAHAAERALHERFEALDRLNVSLSSVLTTVDRGNEEAVLQAVVQHVLSWLGAERAEVHLEGKSPRHLVRKSVPIGAATAGLEVSVPIKLGPRTLGRITIGLSRANGTLDDVRRTLELVAERVGVALETAHLNRAESNERERLALLEHVSRELASCHDLASTHAGLRRALAAVVSDFATACVFYVYEGEALRTLDVAHEEPQRVSRLARLANALAEPLASLMQRSGGTLSKSLDNLGVSPRLERALGFGCITVVPLTVRGKPLGLVAFGYPVERARTTNLTEVFEQLAERCALALDTAKLLEELRTAVESRDTLLAVVSHDLRSPLNAISLTASSLSSVPPDQERRRSGQQIQIIKRSVARMDSLIEDLLTATIIDSGQLTVELSPLEPLDLVRECCMLSEPVSHAKSLTLEQACASDLPLVAADRARVLQVLTNLLGNAIKFTPQGGTLRVEAVRTDEGVRFSVSDTGPGIPPHQLQQVFGRYWTATGSRGARGLGLGLFISQRIVDAHGGRIWVESTPGQGACFSFVLPCAGETSMPAVVLPFRPPSMRTKLG